MKPILALALILSSFAGQKVHALTFLTKGQSLVICGWDASQFGAINKLNYQLTLSGVSAELQGPTTGSESAIITAPFSTSAPFVLSEGTSFYRACATVTKL